MKKLVIQIASLLLGFTFTFYTGAKWDGQDDLDVISSQVDTLTEHLSALDEEKARYLTYIEEAANHIDSLNEEISYLQALTITPESIPMIVLEYDLSLGSAYVPLQMTMDVLYVYKGTYYERKEDIDTLSNVDITLYNIYNSTNIQNYLGTNGTYTVVYATPFSSVRRFSNTALRNTALKKIPRFDVKALGVSSITGLFCYATSFIQDTSTWDNPDNLKAQFYQEEYSINIVSIGTSYYRTIISGC